MQYHHRTLGHFIDLLSEDFHSKVAVKVKTKYRTEKYSYIEIKNLAHQAAEYLIRNGVKKGDKLMVCSPNSIEYIVLIITAGISGIVLLPVDVSSPPDFVKTVVNEADPKAIYCANSALGLIGNATSGKTIKVMHIEDLLPTIRHIDPLDFTRRDYFISDSDLFEIIYTSGTTSAPKGVMLTHKNLTGNLRAIRERMICKQGENFLCILPLSHMFGQIIGLLYPFRFGSAVTVLEETNSIIISEALVKEKISFIVTVPEFLHLLHNRLLVRVEEAGKTKVFLKMLRIAKRAPKFVKRWIFKSLYKKFGENVKTIFCGGAALNIETELFWENVGIQVIQGYGLTECSPVITSSNPTDRALGSVGKVLPRQGVKIAGDGEIMTYGENVFSGYYKREKLNNELFEDGWFRTGDIGELDENGNLFIRGRKKNMLLSASGMNVYPEDIESEIDKLDEIRASTVVGNTADSGKLTINAILIPNPETKPDLSRIKDKINKKLQPHQKVNNIYVWPDEDFPRTHTLKVIRRMVEVRLSDLQGVKSKQGDALKTGDEKSDFLTNLLSKLAEISTANIQESSSLQGELGLDSIRVIELIVSLEETTGRRIDENAIDKNTTVADIRNLLNAKIEDNSPTSLAQWPFKRFVDPFRALFYAIFNFYFSKKVKIKVLGKENLDNINGRVLIIANHQSYIDTPAILACLPKKIRRRMAVAAAREHFFEGKGKLFIFWYMLIFNIFSFYRVKNFSVNFTNIGKLVNTNWSVLLYPEGTRTRSGEMQEFKQGLGMIVKSMRLPVLPIKVEGLYELMPHKATKITPGTATVKLGELQSFSKYEDYRNITKTLEQIIKQM